MLISGDDTVCLKAFSMLWSLRNLCWWWETLVGVRTHWHTRWRCVVTARPQRGNSLRLTATDGWVSPLKDPLLTAVWPLSMTQTQLSSASPWTGFQASSLPSTFSDSSAVWKTHTGSKNRVITRQNKNDEFQNRDFYFIAQEWRFFSLRKWACCREGNQIRVLVLGVSTMSGAVALPISQTGP